MNKQIWLLDADHIRVTNPATSLVENVNTDSYPLAQPLQVNFVKQCKGLYCNQANLFEKNDHFNHQNNYVLIICAY